VSAITFEKLIRDSVAFLEVHNIDTPRRNVEILLSFLLKESVDYIYKNYEQFFPEALLKKYKKMLSERSFHIPLQYITNEVYFFKYQFFVQKGVFIPRPETELLVEKTLTLYGQYFKPDFVRILDIGTGCGNIAITLAKEIRDCSVTATDISLKSLRTSYHNAVLHKVKSRIMIEKASLFPRSKGKFHIIVSNPPYIPRNDISSLDEEVKREPLRALDGGADGTSVIKKIIRRADTFLHNGSFLLMEIGYGQAESVRNEQCGMRLLSIEKDIADIERVAIFRKS
jgi:release factor glutamine methyltransferase